MRTMEQRTAINHSPMSTYEVSRPWQRNPDEGNRFERHRARGPADSLRQELDSRTSNCCP
jgi:hypothetical protein